MLTILLAAVFLVVGIAAGYLIRRSIASKKFGSVEERIGKQLADAETKAKEIVLEGKEKVATLLIEAKNEEKDRRKEIDVLESRLLNKRKCLIRDQAIFRRKKPGFARAKNRFVRGKIALIRKKGRYTPAWRPSPDFP